MPTCPNGHQSGSDDWCEVCGHRMAGAGAPAGAVPPPPPPPPSPPPAPGGPLSPGSPGGYGYPNQNPNRPPGLYDPNATAQAELCPQCRTPREAQAPFCEECRYNFLTHSPTAYTPPPPQQLGGPLPPGFQQQPSQGPPPQGPPPPPPPPVPQGYQSAQGPPPGYDYQSSRPSQMNRPAEPLVPQQPHQPHQPQQPQQQAPHGVPQQAPYQQAPPPAQSFRSDGDWTLPPPAQAPSAPPAPDFGAGAQQQQQQQPYGAPAPAPAAQPAGWVAVVAPDREYFLAMMGRSGPEASGLNLPAYSPEQQLPLNGHQITIGRRRNSTGESPDIDLSRPPEDPGVSHQHALLVRQPDGSWSVVDQDSTNGTTLNGGEEPIQPFVPIPLQDGDRVHVGAWTTITLRRG
ncbi:FHA domain-containing protein [Streptomyces sp. 8N706]|uniref:FHA domain-containing protein n=1 Tax=Streptomyces sp. 8N706 TaxID=3457416 RepID=UPI003FCF916E